MSKESLNKTDKVTSIKIAGLGGMGILKSSLILAEILFRKGWDVKKAEVHGMSQRGGSICSDVRFGKKVFSPMIPAGDLDYLVIFQDDQIPLYENDISPKTKILKPDMINVEKLPSKRTLNVAMLGLLSKELDIEVESWHSLIGEMFPGFIEANKAAFEIGRQ